MAHHYKVPDTLSHADLIGLQQYVAQPAVTISKAHKWVKGKGYKISRSAVGRYVRNLRAGVRPELQQMLSGVIGNDTKIRKLIASIAGELVGETLHTLATMAGYLMFTSRAPGARRPRQAR